MTDVHDDADPRTGDLLAGRYLLENRVGEGATAAVYRATDTQLKRTVAIKLLRGSLDEAASIDRARSETTVLASLNHPSLVTLFDATITPDGVSYLVMEYVEGITLRGLIATGPVDEPQAASIALDLAEGLHVAHDAGIVHRDMKPSNVLLRRSPVPGKGWVAKIADFGIAYLLDSTRLTSPGMMVGTIAYIAPEQARGEVPSPAADIYAVGLMLIEALTGVRPYAEAEGIGALVARMHRPPDIPEHLDPVWRGLLRGMTASRPEDRPTALEVAEVAARLAARHPVASEAPELATAAMAVPDAAATTVALPSGDAPTLVAPVAPLPEAPRTTARARPTRRTLGLLAGGAAVLLLLGGALATVWANTPTPTPTTRTVEQSIAPSPSRSAVVSTPTQTANTVVDTGANTNTGNGKGNGKGGGPGNGKSGGPGNGKGKKP